MLDHAEAQPAAHADSPSAAFILSATGPVAAHLGDSFESRPEQLAMTNAVEGAMSADRSTGFRHAFIEAGTGVGKSYAYLAPAMLRCLRDKERVVIATHTISLQEQLIQKDIPLMVAALEAAGLSQRPDNDDAPDPAGTRIKPVLVKGRGNYVSIRRLRLASQRQSSLLSSGSSLRSLHIIEDWATHTQDGTRSTIPPLEPGGMSIWEKVESDAGNCMGRACPSYDRCFYQAARAKIHGANLFVCNHAIFFADLALRAGTGGEVGILPDYHHVILDEAHNIEEVASEHFGISLTEYRVHHLLASLYHARTGKGFLSTLEREPRRDPEQSTALLDRACQSVLEGEHDAHAFFERWGALVRAGRLPSGRIPEPDMIDNPLSPAMQRLATILKGLKDETPDQQAKFELNAYAQRAEEIAAAAAALTSQTVPGAVYWVESSGSSDPDPAAQRRSSARLRIACSPIQVAPILREHLFSRPFSVILTSATLATGGARSRRNNDAPPADDSDAPTPRIDAAFSHAAASIGCDAAGTLRVGSPFDYARQAALYVEADIPDPRAREPLADQPEAPPPTDELSPLAAAALRHIRATRGGAFVLCTSFSSLFQLADELDARLTDLGYPILIQGRSGSRALILDRFRENPSSVLFGAASFWQGVDVRGDALRNVIMTRLPFEPPDRPLTQARLEAIKARGGNPFMEDSLPRAIIRFKQGFGRLIRSRTDSGRVVVLDPRIVTARYGRLFLDALPDGVRIILPDQDECA